MIYDYIIYPANLFGISVSIKLSGLGKRVLLLNKYGFVGGSISSALNIYQAIVQPQQSVTNLIYNSLFTEQGILQEEGNHIFINPEIYKLVCQKFLENSQIGLLFHVKPIGMIKKHESYKVELIGKEGLIELEAKQIVDMSEQQELSVLANFTSRKLVSQKINLITAPNTPDSEIGKITFGKKFADGRMFISQEIETDEIDEKKAQDFLTAISFSLNKIGSRIQIAPVESQVSYRFTPITNISGLINLTSLNLAEIKDDECFINSQKIEKYFDK